MCVCVLSKCLTIHTYTNTLKVINYSDYLLRDSRAVQPHVRHLRCRELTSVPEVDVVLFTSWPPSVLRNRREEKVNCECKMLGFP